MFVSGVVAFGITVVLLPVAERCLRRLQVFDHPSNRSFHERATVRGGGLALAAGALGGLAVSGIDGDDRLVLVCATLLFGAIGLLDDLRGVDALRRLAVQAVAALVVVTVLVQVAPPWPVWAVVLVPFWLVAFVNAFNFMDGINGISSATAVVAGMAWWTVGGYANVPSVAGAGVIIAAAALGFLPFNFPTARLFLGDVGSYFVGAWLAVVVVVGVQAGIPAEAVVAPLALYLVDTGTTLVRRVARGAVWYEAHCEHVYQRLMRAGWSHGATTSFVAGCSLVMSALGTLSLSGSVELRILGVGGMVTMVAGYLVAPRVAMSSRLHRTALVP